MRSVETGGSEEQKTENPGENGSYSVLPGSVKAALNLGGHLNALRNSIPEESEMVDMILQHFPEKVREYADEQGINLENAAEELIEGYVMTDSIESFLEACRINMIEPRIHDHDHDLDHDTTRHYTTVKSKRRGKQKSLDKMIAAVEGRSEDIKAKLDEIRRTGTVIRGIVDSGAVDHVMHRKVAPQFPVKQTSAVGIEYKVANGRPIYNEGQKDLKGFTANGMPIELGMQITDVAATLFSVKKMKDAGNIVIFGAEEGDMIINKSTGVRTPIIDTGRDFLLEVLLPGGKVSHVPKTPVQKECPHKVVRGGYWNALMNAEEEETE